MKPGIRQVDVLVVGAGQAGLGAAQALARTPGLELLVLEAAGALGQSWTGRWDSLRLFTPRWFSALPGLRFPAGEGRAPTRLEMAAYLTRYAEHHRLAVQVGVRVDRITCIPAGFEVQTTEGPVLARQVVVATGPFHRAYLPECAADLDPAVHQLHSADYRRPDDVPGPAVAVVGGGNSAAQLAVELSRTHAVTLVSPGPPWFLPTSILGLSLYWWTLATGVLNAPAESRVSRYVRRRGDAVVGRELAALVRQGTVRLVPHRVVSASGEGLTLQDGSVLPVGSVLWCTGFRPDYRWLEVPGALTDDGRPVHTGGASPVRGLHWVGLPWQTRLNSSIINGIDRDARALARRVTSQRRPAPVTG